MRGDPSFDKGGQAMATKTDFAPEEWKKLFCSKPWKTAKPFPTPFK
jgi:hypothetical protein